VSKDGVDFGRISIKEGWSKARTEIKLSVDSWAFSKIKRQFWAAQGVWWVWFSHDETICLLVLTKTDFNFIKNKQTRVDLSVSALARQEQKKLSKLISNSTRVSVLKLK
jgi:hypothetical protein